METLYEIPQVLQVLTDEDERLDEALVDLDLFVPEFPPQLTTKNKMQINPIKYCFIIDFFILFTVVKLIMYRLLPPYPHRTRKTLMV